MSTAVAKNWRHVVRDGLSKGYHMLSALFEF